MKLSQGELHKMIVEAVSKKPLRNLSTKDVDTICTDAFWAINGAVRKIMMQCIEKNNIDLGNHVAREKAEHIAHHATKEFERVLSNMVHEEPTQRK